MTRLFAPRILQHLAQLTASRVLLAFDYDGTLAPIVANRELAGMRDETLSLFRELCELYPCAVISGRAKADVGARLAPARVKHVIGNHGLEPGENLSEFAAEIALMRPLLEAALAKYPGVELEDKLYSLAIHYRGSRQRRSARAAIYAALSALPLPLRIVPGKLVANVIPARAAHKGDALMDVCRWEMAECALYVGDDVTDEDVFRNDESGRVFTVRVGYARRSAAKYFLRNQLETDALLAKLLEFRRQP